MNEQSQTAADTTAEQTLCKMGCGFFGNGATNGCCSKCWREAQKKAGNLPEPAAPLPVVQAPPAAAKPIAPIVTETPTPMEVDDEIPSTAETTTENPAPAATATAPTKKKKKASYKNMMKDMLKSDAQGKDSKEKDALRNGLGGGAFSKIDKI